MIQAKSGFHIVLLVFIHLLAVFLVFLPTIIVTFSKIKPYNRGFYCDDESIRYPFKKGTIPFYVVGIIGFGIPLIIIALTETFHKRSKLRVKSQTFLGIPEVVINIYIFWGVYTFGAGFDQMLTNSAKFLIGRLRPFFINACQVDFSKVNCSNHNYVVIDNSFCMEVDPKILRDIRVSFPSGHSSFSAYCAVSFSIYLMKRWMLPRIYVVLRTLLQALYIGLAIMCGLSRVSDYKHHWSDVLTGLTSGTIVAILVWCYFINIDIKKDLDSDHECSVDTEMFQAS